jgi:hypothetical protein
MNKQEFQNRYSPKGFFELIPLIEALSFPPTAGIPGMVHIKYAFSFKTKEKCLNGNWLTKLIVNKSNYKCEFIGTKI